MKCLTVALNAATGLAVALLLVACGGGGDSQSAPPTTSVPPPNVPPPPPLHQSWEPVTMSMKLDEPPYLDQMYQARQCLRGWGFTPCKDSDQVSHVDFWLATTYGALADERLVGSEIDASLDLQLGATFGFRIVRFPMYFGKPAELVASPVHGTPNWAFDSLYRQDVSFHEVTWRDPNISHRSYYVSVRKAQESANTLEVELTVISGNAGIQSREYVFLHGIFVPE